MAFVGIDSFRHHQPPNTVLRRDGRPTASSLYVPVASGESNNPMALGLTKEPTRTPQDFDLIEISDMTGSTTKEPLDPLHEPASDLNTTQVDNRDTLNGLDTTHGHAHSGGEEEDDFPALEELLPGMRKAQERQQMGSTDGHGIGGSEGNFKHVVKDDRDSAASPRSSEGENKEEWIAAVDDCLDDNYQNVQREAVSLDNPSRTPDADNDDMEFAALRKLPPPKFRYPSGLGPHDRDTHASSTWDKPGSSGDPIIIQDKDTDSSSNDTSEEQDGNQGPLSTPSTSIAGSEASIPKLSQKDKHSTLELPPPHRNTIISSKHVKSMCESEGGNHKSLIPNPSADDDKKDQRDHKEAEIADEEKFGGDRERNTPPLPYSTKKRPLSTVGEEAHVKRLIKRRHLSSTFLSESQVPPQADLDVECETARLDTGSLGTIANTPCLKRSQGQAHPTLHEDDEWEIVRILGNRRIGKSYEYRVLWRSIWLPKSALRNAQALLRDFEGNSPAQRGRREGRRACTDEEQ